MFALVSGARRCVEEAASSQREEAEETTVAPAQVFHPSSGEPEYELWANYTGVVDDPVDERVTVTVAAKGQGVGGQAGIPT